MTADPAKEKIAVASKPSIEDLSKEVEQSVERLADERIKVVRVFDNLYRCNWWVADKSTAFWLATGTIRKSRLLRATKTKDSLVVEDVTLGDKAV